MKRYGNLFEQIYEIGNIELAHKNARKGKRKYIIFTGSDVLIDQMEKYGTICRFWQP